MQRCKNEALGTLRKLVFERRKLRSGGYSPDAAGPAGENASQWIENQLLASERRGARSGANAAAGTRGGEGSVFALAGSQKLVCFFPQRPQFQKTTVCLKGSTICCMHMRTCTVSHYIVLLLLLLLLPILLILANLEY